MEFLNMPTIIVFFAVLACLVGGVSPIVVASPSWPANFLGKLEFKPLPSRSQGKSPWR